MAGQSVQSIVELYESMDRNDGGRNSSYSDVIRYYTGSDLETTQKQGFLSGIASAISSIFSPRDEDEDLELHTPINIVKPAIDNKVAFLSMLPTVEVIPPPDSLAPNPAIATPGPSGAPGLGAAEVEGLPGTPPTPPVVEALPLPPEAQVEQEAQPEAPQEDWPSYFADRLEKSIDSLLDASNLTRRCRDVAWSISATGGAVIGVWPDLRHNRPKIFTRTPYKFYPVAYDDDGLELQMALWADKMTGREVFAQYGVKDYIDEDEVDIIFCMDEENFYTVLNNEKWAHDPIENTLGIVPIVCIGSLGVPGMIFGSTEFKDALPVANEINYHMALQDKIANATVEPTIFITDPLEVPDDLAIGKGGVATAGKDGSATLLGPLPLPNSFWNLGEVLNNWFDLIADNPAVLRAEGQGSIITGKGFNAQMGPVASRLQTKLDLMMSGWKRVIKYMLIMWANFPGMKAQKVSGVKRKEFYYFEAEPSEFLINGEIWTEIDVYVNAQSYIDRNSDRIGLIQLYEAELLDWDSAVGQLDEVRDRAKVRRGIDKDRLWKAKGVAMQTAAAQPPAPPMNPTGVEEEAYAMERGAMPEGPAPMEEMGMPAEEPAPIEPVSGNMELTPPHQGILDALQDFFSGISKLRGQAWWGGDPIKNPAALNSENWMVTVWITDPQDQGTITRAAAAVDIIYGHIKFIRGVPSPEEDAVQFSQGTGEALPAENPDAAVPTGLNPDLDTMLQGQV